MPPEKSTDGVKDTLESLETEHFPYNIAVIAFERLRSVFRLFPSYDA